jgi:hypothetical protein
VGTNKGDDASVQSTPRGSSADNAKIVNLVDPLPKVNVNGMDVDMARFAQAAEHLGAGKGDVLTIDGHRNAKGQWVANYDSIRIERRADDE